MYSYKLRNIVNEAINRFLIFESAISPIEAIVYHRSFGGLQKENFENELWFSNEVFPDKNHGDVIQKCRIRMNNPLIVDAQGESWSSPLYHWMYDDNGNQIKQANNPRLLKMAPIEVWKAVEEDDEGDLEWGSIPWYVKHGYIKGNYDGIIIKNISETCQGNFYCDDYIIFDYNQIIEIIK